MADFWSGFTQGFTPTYLNTRSRRDRKLELERARQELLADRDTVRQQRLGDMASDRQQRLDDLAAANARQDRITAAARKYAEDRERRKFRVALQSFDPSVSKQAMEEAFLAQPQEEQDAAMMARGGFPFEGDSGEARELDPSRMKGKVGYPDLGEEGTWGASARAAILQVPADAAKKIRADLAAEGNKYGKVQRRDQTNSDFAAEIEGAKSEAEINLARGKAAATAGGTKSINVRERATATLGFIRSIDAGGGGDTLKNTREAFAQRDEDGVILKDENGEIVDRIDEATGLPEWEVYLGSETVHEEMKLLAKEWSRYRAVFQRSPKMLPDDVDNRGAAVARLTAEIEGELKKRGTSAQQFDLQQIKIAQNPDDYDEKTVAVAKAYIDLKGGQFIEVTDPATGRKIVTIGRRPTGTDEDPEPSELDYALLKMNGLRTSYDPDNPSVGWIASMQSFIGDKVLTQVGIEKWADEDRIQYRQAVKEFGVAYTKALNAPDSRMSDNDRKLLLPLAPDVNDSPFEFQAKLKKIDETVKLLRSFNSAYKGQKSIWDLKPQGIMGLRRQKGEGGKTMLNDELARLIIRERFGKGVTSDAVITQAKTMYDNEELNDEELKFFLNSALRD